MMPIKLNTVLHPKAWGSELWCCNNDEFCGKILTLKKGRRFSLHMHSKKREVFHVLTGCLNLTYMDTRDASEDGFAIFPGDSIEIPRMCPHRLEALEDSVVIEFSTHHEDSDSYRVAPGDSQRP